VEYDLTTGTIVNEIACFEKSDKISEYCNNDSIIVYVVSSKNETGTYKDIYSYNFLTRELHLVRSNITAAFNDDYANKLYVALFDNYVYWLNPNLEEKKSEIVKYDLFSGATTIIVEKPHLNNQYLDHVPIKYINVQGNFLLFNDRSNSTPESITVYELRTMTQKFVVDLPDGSEKSYNAIYYHNDRNIYIYADLDKKEVIYRFNPETGKILNLVGIYPHSNLYKDKMQIIDNNILYSMQFNVTGYIQDHYFSEIYDLSNYELMKYQYTFNILETEGYFGLLRFDKSEGINEIHLELYEKIIESDSRID